MENIENGENKIFKAFYFSIFEMPKGVDLTNLKQLDNWSILIEGAQGRANEIFEAVKRDLEESSVPLYGTVILDSKENLRRRQRRFERGIE
jgi:hypothetical protein